MRPELHGRSSRQGQGRSGTLRGRAQHVGPVASPRGGGVGPRHAVLAARTSDHCRLLAALRTPTEKTKRTYQYMPQTAARSATPKSATLQRGQTCAVTKAAISSTNGNPGSRKSRPRHTGFDHQPVGPVETLAEAVAPGRHGVPGLRDLAPGQGHGRAVLRQSRPSVLRKDHPGRRMPDTGTLSHGDPQPRGGHDIADSSTASGELRGLERLR